MPTFSQQSSIFVIFENIDPLQLTIIYSPLGFAII